ncbi:MAG: type II toxin-antitoxin system CcdA family antitoxin [Archaeoglobaceae archaeon]
MKKRTSLYVDAELLDWAKRNGVNISQLLENVLKSLQNGEKRVEFEGLRPCPVGVRGFESRPPHEKRE